MSTQGREKIVIVGGGFAGLESALYLHQRLGDQADITLLSSEEKFVFKPYLAYVPFGLLPDSVSIDLKAVVRGKAIAFCQAHLDQIDPVKKEVVASGEVFPYDYLILATGAAIAPDTLPGLSEHGYLIWRTHDLTRLQAAYQQLVEKTCAGERQRVVFLVPPACQWAGPLYEMAFMLETWFQWKEVRANVDISFITSEQAFMSAFGHQMHDVIEEAFEQRQIEGHTNVPIAEVGPSSLMTEDGTRIPYDLLVAAPAFKSTTTWPHLPMTAEGFLKTELASRQVLDYPDIYAVGDGADYPVKQAFLALLQADAAAEHLAAHLLGEEPDFSFDPKSLWVMEQLDQALFAKVPLSEAGEVFLENGQEDTYSVDPVPVGQFRRILVSAHLPRTSGINPLYAGLLWKGTKLGLQMLVHLTK